MADETDLVSKFFLDLVPKHLVETSQLLASLDYPIKDRKSLVSLVEKRKAEDPKGDKGYAALSRPIEQLIDTVVRPFEAGDFGLDSPQNALEKFFARMSQDKPLRPVGPRPPKRLPDSPVGEPGPWVPFSPDDMDFAFGFDPCGIAAKEKWIEILDSAPSWAWTFPNEWFAFDYRDLVERMSKCRTAEPLFLAAFRDGGGVLRGTGSTDLNPCEFTARVAFARCNERGGDQNACSIQAQNAYDRCVRSLSSGLTPPRPGP